MPKFFKNSDHMRLIWKYFQKKGKNRFWLWYSGPIRLDGNSLSDSLTDVNSWKECKELKFVFCYSNRKSILHSSRHVFDKYKILLIKSIQNRILQPPYFEVLFDICRIGNLACTLLVFNFDNFDLVTVSHLLYNAIFFGP